MFIFMDAAESLKVIGAQSYHSPEFVTNLFKYFILHGNKPILF